MNFCLPIFLQPLGGFCNEILLKFVKFIHTSGKLSKGMRRSSLTFSTFDQLTVQSNLTNYFWMLYLFYI